MVNLSTDRIDLEILRALLEDSKASLRKVAKHVGLAPGTVLSRIERIKRQGILRRYTISLDYEKLGYSTAITEITVSKGKLVEVEEQLAKLPGVCAVYDVTGEIDAIVVVKFKDTAELSKFTKRVLSIPNVERTNTHVVLTTVKEDFNLALWERGG
jgi:DNA-binding Lrp family transcriptional regulator